MPDNREAPMKWLLIAVAAVLGLGVVIYLVGAFLSTEHVATVEAQYRAPIDEVYALIENVERGPSWRTGLERVEVLSAPGEPLQWREHTSFGPIVMRRDEAVAPTRIVATIADTTGGFGGRWVYELTPHDGGTTLRITEHGEVYSPLFRFMSRFVFGHHRTLEQYARDVGRNFGEDATPVRS
jgi:uncharacterized protein YndB with AHSA1/START domain